MTSMEKPQPSTATSIPTLNDTNPQPQPSYKNKLLAFSSHSYFSSWLNNENILETEETPLNETMECEGKLAISLSPEVRARIRIPWCNSLIIKLLGGHLRLPILHT
ncbi:hypothetical protein COLO4_29214 [Corchorus olitorius]|uniref:Uncharacterized protein n=1 Tax=Corchorus olitorius TaxID=93759 RepID=A0A1R3HFV2_9ROSI|nr:hypothetical protein COLO4_29214 [Corchorus olitorius]